MIKSIKKLFGHKRHVDTTTTKSDSSKSNIVEQQEEEEDTMTCCNSSITSSSTHTIEYNLNNNSSCCTTKLSKENHHHHHSNYHRPTVVRFNEDCNQIHVIDDSELFCPTNDDDDSSSSTSLYYYSTEDVTQFKNEYNRQRQMLSLASRVLQQTYKACQQVSFETTRCCLTQQEEDQLLDCFFCHNKNAASGLCGLEVSLLLQPSNHRSKKLAKTIVYNNNNNKNNMAMNDKQLQLICERSSRPDRLFARLMAQANAVVLQEEESSSSF